MGFPIKELPLAIGEDPNGVTMISVVQKEQSYDTIDLVSREI